MTLWGIDYVAIKIVQNSLTTLTLMFIRYLLGFIVISVFMAMNKSRARFRMRHIPVMIVCRFFKDKVEELFSSLWVVGGALLLTAVLLYFSDAVSKSKIERTNNSRNGISFLQALLVGIGQALAVLPGLSRSGATISTGLISGVRREVVAQFSFLMVIIPILGDMFLEIVGGGLAASTVGVMPLAIGFVAAFATGLFACKAMIALVKKAQLKWFALYCLLVGLTVIITQIF